jgi:hypothetical protein
MHGDEQCKADTENDQRNEKVAVSENSFGFLDRYHGEPWRLLSIDWRNHKDAAG